MDKISTYLNKVKIPQNSDKIYKEECIYSFDNPETDTGLFICLNTFLGIGKEYVSKYSALTGNCLFLHIHHIKTEIPPENEPEPDKKIARLAIGVEGGFHPDVGKKKYDIKEEYKIVILPDFVEIPYPSEELPEIIRLSVEAIIKKEGALHFADVEATAQAWDGEVRKVTRYSDTLEQLPTDKKIPSSGWKCETCDLMENLWMNLTDGRIFCGRRQLDGSGGNHHAYEHHLKTGFPLAVKLGTITPDGKADVYSYIEDDMVIDSNLVAHLAHFGINVSLMQKTEKTMLELEIDMNQRGWEWSRLTESGANLSPRYGPGYAGLQNLGNSCYLNSVMQVLMTIPSFMERFYGGHSQVMELNSPTQIPQDFNSQMSKLSYGILSGKYSQVPTESSGSEKVDTEIDQVGISPLMFRTLVGRGHPEFSTKKQQDAMEFLEHILKLTSRSSIGRDDPGHCFKFEVEDKFVCSASGKVRYVTREDLYLPLPVPLEAATNKDEVTAYLERRAEAQAKGLSFKPEDQVHSQVPFSACLSKLVAPADIDAFSSAVGKEVPMQKITRLSTFPQYLVIQLVKFGISANWEPFKYDVSVSMPDHLDLSVLKGFGVQPGEELLPDTQAPPKAPQIDEAVVAQLSEMGFPVEACRKAIHFTGNTGSEAAMNWIMEHMADPDFASPLPALSADSDKRQSFMPDENGLAMLMSMGFTQDQASLALKETDNNLERAADWIFSHQPVLDSLVAAAKGSNANKASSSWPQDKKQYSDGAPTYELVAFISHMGTSIFVGHYVCHIKKDGEWTIFNDNKVFKSENPPKDLAYIYFYKRINN